MPLPAHGPTAIIARLAAAVAAACLLAVSPPVAAAELVFAEELPPPTATIDAIQADIRRLEKEIESLRAAKNLPAPDTAPGKAGETLTDRLSTLEKGLGKLTDAADKKKKDDAKKPLFILSGQMQADQVYFG